MDNVTMIFNEVYKKYHTKDYFTTKEIIRNQILYLKRNNINYKLSEIKTFLKNEKIKCYNMILKRIEQKKQGEYFPKREKFTWEIFNKLAI